jgi:hypothetical protein
MRVEYPRSFGELGFWNRVSITRIVEQGIVHEQTSFSLRLKWCVIKGDVDHVAVIGGHHRLSSAAGSGCILQTVAS